MPALAPDLALRRLTEGNARFIAGRSELATRGFRPGLEEGQSPFAVVLGCSDSRTPAELVFDQGLGDLFVIRVAGNVVAPSLVGSVEFAADQFGSRLVVVMGHSRCGAVSATVDLLRSGGSPKSGNIRAITERIRPHVQEVVGSGEGQSPAAVLDAAVRANVRASVSQLRSGSHLLEELIRAGSLRVVGAVYELATGRVELLDPP